MSVQGLRIRYFALALALIAIAAGVYFTFFQSRGFEKTQAKIVSIEELPRDFEDDDPTYDVTVEYTVGGKSYTQKLDSYDPTYKVGKTIEIKYDPADPTVIHGGGGFGIYVLVIGAVIFVGVVASIIIGRISLKKVREAAGGEEVYPPAEYGEERELYFITDIGTPKYGHRIEDGFRQVLYEAKMTKFTLTSPFGFDFIDHVNGKTTPHLVGHEESSEWDTLLLDNHYTFKFDGVDIWKHLKKNGITVDSSIGGGSGKLIGANYVIFRDGVELARAESTSRYVHEEEAAEHKAASAIPAQGFYRIWTREKNLGLIFVTLLAFARTGATGDNGGNYKAIFGSLGK